MDLKFGKRVRIDKRLKKHFKTEIPATAGSLRSMHGFHVWESEDIAPIYGLFLGYRTIYSTRIEYLGRDEGYSYSRLTTMRCLLVCPSARENPIYVPLDGVMIRRKDETKAA